MAVILRYLPNLVALGANYVGVVKNRSILSRYVNILAMFAVVTENK